MSHLFRVLSVLSIGLALTTAAFAESIPAEAAATQPMSVKRVATNGHLVIVGGGLKPDNEPIYRAVLDRIGPDGRLGVLPTASGVPEKSGPGTVEDFRQYAGPNQSIELIDLRNGEIDKARDPEWVQRIADCDGLWFTGGVQSRIVDTFRPEDEAGDTPAYDAMWGLLDRGGVIGGTSAGAAMMSDPMIKWGNSHDALLVGVVNDVEDHGVGVGKGMGFLPPGGIVDQHFFRRGRLGRLLVAMVNRNAGSGMGVGENTAWVLDMGGQGGFEVIGPNGVLLVARGGSNLYPDGRKLPNELTAVFLRDGFRLEEHGPGTQDNAYASAPTVEQIAEAASGAPRDYDGRLPVLVEFVRHDRTWPAMTEFRLRSHDSDDPQQNDRFFRLEQDALSALEAKRNPAP